MNHLVPEIRVLQGDPRLPLFEDKKREAHLHHLLLITSTLTVVSDEANSLSRLRQYFPKESKFCFAFTPPAHHKPRFPAWICPQATIWLAAALSKWKHSAWVVQGLRLLLVNDNVCIGYPYPFHWKSNNCHFLSLFFSYVIVYFENTYVWHMAGD